MFYADSNKIFALIRCKRCSSRSSKWGRAVVVNEAQLRIRNLNFDTFLAVYGNKN